MDGDTLERDPRLRELGSFSVTLGTLTCESFGRSSSEDLPLSLWLSVQVVNALETPLERVWFTPNEENAKTLSVAVIPGPKRASVAAPVDYEQNSRPVALTQESLQELMASTLLISLYAGEARTQDKDSLVGVAAVPMDDVLLAGHSEQCVVIQDAEAGEFSLSLSIQSDADLAEFLIGARLVRLHSPVLGDLPPEWTIQGCASDDDAVQACAATERNTATYDLSITIPRHLTTNNEDTTTTLLFKGGKLQYEPHPGDFSPPLQDSQHDEVDAAAPTMTGSWIVRFPDASTESILYLKDSVRHLVDFLVVEKRVQCVLTRNNLETNITKATETVSSEFEIALNDLLAPGVAQIVPRGFIQALRPIERSILEQELSAATSNDDKKKLQALLGDFDASITGLAASVTASVTASIMRWKTYAGITVEVANRPLVPQPSPELEPPSRTLEDMVTHRDVEEEYEEQRNPIEDLRREIRGIIVQLLREYEETFRGPEEAEVTRNDKRQALIFRLNTQGVYHAFKESLKKRIISVIRDRFSTLDGEEDGSGQQTASTGDSNEGEHDKNSQEKLKERFGQLYALLMEEVHTVLRDTFYADNGTIEKTSEAIDGKPSHAEISRTLATLMLKAMENEVNGDLEKSETLHLDRVAYIEQLLATPRAATFLVDCAKGVWFEYACFCMRTGKLDKAGANLTQCIRLASHDLPAIIALAALQLELGDFVQAEDIVKIAIQLAVSTSGAAGGGSWELAVLAHALLAYYYSQSGKDKTGNLTLFELIKAQQVLRQLGGDQYQHPNICAATVWIVLAEYAQEHSLRTLLKTSLLLANASIGPRHALSDEQRVLRLVLGAWLSVSEGDVFNDVVVNTLRDAIEIDPSHPLAWFTLGKLYLQRDSQAGSSAIECFQRAMEQRRRLRIPDRMALYVHLGLALLHTSQFAAAEKVFLVSCDEFHNASSWLGVGISCLRMENWNGAQLALAMANRLDNTHPDVWGYLALHALTAHPHVTASDEQDANQFVSQALRYNLSNPALLRELSNGFIAIDRLEHAERLLRRSLACQDSSLTRKTLADVLAAQNCAEDALRQYAQSLNSAETVEERCDLLEKSAQLLVTLGRPEEAADYRAMASEFHA